MDSDSTNDGPDVAASSTTDGKPVLECRGLVAGYGRVNIIRSFDLVAGGGTVVAILGPNGAGKTTLLTTVVGLLPRQGGSVLIHGKPLRSGRPTDASRAGLVMVADDRALFGELTVWENLKAAAPRRSTAPEEMMDRFPALRGRASLAAASLSGGEQQMLAVARALVQRPKVLLIDEMSMGLAPVIVEYLLPMVRDIADETNAVVVIVEQHVGLALEVADQAMLLVHGEVVVQGAAADLRRDPARLEAAYLGVATASGSTP